MVTRRACHRLWFQLKEDLAGQEVEDEGREEEEDPQEESGAAETRLPEQEEEEEEERGYVKATGLPTQTSPQTDPLLRPQGPRPVGRPATDQSGG